MLKYAYMKNRILQSGKETFKKVSYSVEYIRYSFRHIDGTLFLCLKFTEEDCRKARNRWIERSYLLYERQIVYDTRSGEPYLVFNPNVKGHVVLIEIGTAQIKYAGRYNFFNQYDISGPNNLITVSNETDTYELMLKSYHLQFSKKK